MYIHETQPYKIEVTVQQDCDDEKWVRKVITTELQIGIKIKIIILLTQH